ncbi:MAG: class I SAM-dependent methyltransferase [Promethearchaeota archaeon]
MKVHDHYYTSKPKSPETRHSFIISERGILLRLETARGVFSYKKLDKGTEVLIRFLRLPREPARVLDLGSGYGVVALILAKLLPTSRVTAVEVNERAYRCLVKNCELNGVTNVEPVLGDFFEYETAEPFDAVYSNPPVKLGRKTLIRILTEEVPRFLKQTGFAQVVFRTNQGAKYYRELIREHAALELEGEKIKAGYRVLTFRRRG